MTLFNYQSAGTPEITGFVIDTIGYEETVKIFNAAIAGTSSEDVELQAQLIETAVKRTAFKLITNNVQKKRRCNNENIKRVSICRDLLPSCIVLHT